MALITGSATGTMTTSEDIYFEGAPTLYFQRHEAAELYSPDADGYYWQLSGSSTYPVYEVGCLTAVSMTEDITMNDVLCDNVGVKSTVQQRNYLEFNFTLQSFLPFDVLTHILKGGTVTETAPMQKFGLGKINNNVYWHAYWPKVYDEDVGDYIAIHLHKCQFVDSFNIDMPFGSPWQAPVKLRAFVDPDKPAAQQFGVFLRADASVIT
jgi:hypothetical protein